MGELDLRLSGQQLGSQLRAAGLFGLDFLPQVLGLASSPLDVSVYFVAVPQVVGDGAIDIRQVERRIATGNGFRFGSVVELVNYDVKQHLRVTHADGAVFIDAKSGGIGLNRQSHGVYSTVNVFYQAI